MARNKSRHFFAIRRNLAARTGESPFLRPTRGRLAMTEALVEGWSRPWSRAGWRAVLVGASAGVPPVATMVAWSQGRPNGDPHLSRHHQRRGPNQSRILPNSGAPRAGGALRCRRLPRVAQVREPPTRDVEIPRCHECRAQPHRRRRRGGGRRRFVGEPRRLARAGRGAAIHSRHARDARNTPQVKVEAVRRRAGGRVVLCEPTLQARAETLAVVLAETGATEIHPYDNPRVIAGAGTATLDVMADVPDLDLVIAPVSGGGLLSGTAIAARGCRPAMAVWGAEPRTANNSASFARQRRPPRRSGHLDRRWTPGHAQRAHPHDPPRQHQRDRARRRGRDRRRHAPRVRSHQARDRSERPRSPSPPSSPAGATFRPVSA